MKLSPEGLAKFKERAKAFFIMYEALVSHWNRKDDEHIPDTYPIATTIAVIVQNIQFDGTNTHGYDHEKEVNKVDDLIKVLKIVYDYDQSYMSLLPYNELNSLWYGIYMSDEEKW